MTREEYNSNIYKAEFGVSPDNLNPALILSGVSTELLTQVIKGEIDLNEIAKREMENRGFDENGKWVGFGIEIK
ncbi:MAG: hypothetical protein ACQETL_19030 [Bacteroidota bacterium]